MTSNILHLELQIMELLSIRNLEQNIIGVTDIRNIKFHTVYKYIEHHISII